MTTADQTTTAGSDGLIHWWSPQGATHAVVDVTDWHGTVEPEQVTCETCRVHILAAQPTKRAGVRINAGAVHVRQVGPRPKTRCGRAIRTIDQVEQIDDVDALAVDIPRCRICFPGSAR